MKNHKDSKFTEKNNAIERAILDGIEAYNREQTQKVAPKKEKPVSMGEARSKEAMKEAGYAPVRRSRAKGKGTLLPGNLEQQAAATAVKPPKAAKKAPAKKQSKPKAAPPQTAQNETEAPQSTALAVQNTTQVAKIQRKTYRPAPLTHSCRAAKSEPQEPVKTQEPVKPKRSGKKQPVRVLFFGGVGEIGKNMTAIEFGNDIIIIDAGVSFPTEEMPGIDLVFPEITYLAENKEKIRALFLTHGHEDHIGGVPYLMKELGVDFPVYGTKLTLALADGKLREHKMNHVRLETVSPKEKVKAGAFTVNFVNVNHSIAGALALAVETPYGVIFHSGDFKIDLTPVAGAPIDLTEIAEYGKKGVLLYLGESTNIERPGFTMSETVVGTTLEHLFSENENRRLIIATFASNVHRLQQIIDIAVKFRRKVALSGRSMLTVVEEASRIGEITIPEGVLVDVEKVKNFFDGEIVIVSTGSQGEPMSALTRMASGEFNKITISPNDTIIISASPIPGNERMIYRVINNLFKLGANVVYESLEKIHVSGHACQEEHKIMHTLLKPKFFIPVHGEYRHLKRHALLAEELGMKPHCIFIPDIGAVAEVTRDTLTQGENIPAGARLIDGNDFEGATSEVLKDRLRLSSEGLLVVSVTVLKGYVRGEPIIENRGVVFADEQTAMREIKEVVDKVIENGAFRLPAPEFGTAIKKAIRNFLFRKTKQSPMIIPMIQEI